jgi:hypothetical protein
VQKIFFFTYFAYESMKNSPSKVAYFSKMGEILSTVLPKAARSA